MKLVKEFKEFISKGNVMDLAIGVIIGGAFGKIVASFVNDIIMPVIGVILGGNSIADLKWILKAGTTPETTISLNYGQFIQNIIDFLLIGFVIFMIIKAMNKFKRKQEAVEEVVEPSEDILLLREIRDSLKK